jgi:hypothetical protein
MSIEKMPFATGDRPTGEYRRCGLYIGPFGGGTPYHDQAGNVLHIIHTGQRTKVPRDNIGWKQVRDLLKQPFVGDDSDPGRRSQRRLEPDEPENVSHVSRLGDAP